MEPSQLEYVINEWACRRAPGSSVRGSSQAKRIKQQLMRWRWTMMKWVMVPRKRLPCPYDGPHRRPTLRQTECFVCVCNRRETQPWTECNRYSPRLIRRKSKDYVKRRHFFITLSRCERLRQSREGEDELTSNSWCTNKTLRNLPMGFLVNRLVGQTTLTGWLEIRERGSLTGQQLKFNQLTCNNCVTWDSQGLFQPDMDEESADERDTDRLGDDAPLPLDFSSLFSAALLASASLAAVNGSFGRETSPVFACLRPIIGVCDKS